MFLLILLGFNLSRPSKEDISFLIEEKLKGEITLNTIEGNPVNKVGVKIDEIIVSVKDELFEKLMQLVG